MKIFQVWITALISASFSIAGDFDNCASSANGTYWRLDNAQIGYISVWDDKITVDATAMVSGVPCTHKFFFSKSNSQNYSLLLTAKSSGTPIFFHFRSGGAVPYVYFDGDLVGTHEVTGLEF